MLRKLLIVILVLPCLALAGVARAEDTPAGQLPSEFPAAGTPHVLDGSVYSIAQVGSTMVLGGDFTTARNDNSNTQLSRLDLLAFNMSTGQISTTFVPNPNGVVRKVMAAPDGTSVYVAGSFTSIGGVARTNLARVRISDGAVLSTFNAGSITGQVRDLALVDGRLWLAGAFTHVGGHAQAALATVNPDTGAFVTYMGLAIAGVHQGGTTQVLKIDFNPSGTRLVAVGNFATLQGVDNRGLFMLDTSGPSAAPSAFRTSFYTAACSSSFDTYMRDVSFSPDGRFFVVVTTGAYRGAGSPCDSSARFEANGTGLVAPSWIDNTGGDTTYSVEVTDAVVYVGGHMRWQNNPFAGDRAGAGAVSREGIAALDPVNGLPLTWDPGRTKGVGVFDFLYTNQGLWVASDTDRIGHFTYKGRIALMPLAGGVSFPAVRTPGLPNSVYSAGTTLDPSGISRRTYSDGSVGASQAVPNGGIDWNTVRGAFMLNGQLYLARNDGSFTRRSFDGSAYGDPVAVNTSDLIVTLTAWHTELQTVTGMFYDSGRIYYTMSGSSSLFYRYFTPQSDVVGAQRYVASGNVSGIDFSQVRGMFSTGSKLYWATPDARLHRIDWAQGAQSGTPVAGTATITSGPGVDTALWGGRTMFLFQGGGGVGAPSAPTAAFTSSCTSLSCSFDASGSSTGGASATYAWQFGDGQTGTGVSPQHTYAAGGSYQVTLTVTTSGGSSSVSHSVTVAQVNQPPTAAFTVACSGLACSFDGRSSTDDGSIASYAWSFGDGSTGTGATPQHTYASAGTRTVQLTVTDNAGATASTSRSVTVGTAAVAFVAAATSNASAATNRVTVPASVQAGDTLVLYFTANSTGATLTPPAGWTQLESVTGDNVLGRLWTRTATASDAGSTVTVSFSTTIKSDLTLAAYRTSGGGASTVVAHAAGLDQTLGSSHRAPAVTTTAAGQWVGTYWAAKTSSAVTWSVPGGQAVRATSTTTGGGLVSAVAVDSAGPVPQGPVAGLVGTTSIDVSRVVMFTVALGLA